MKAIVDIETDGLDPTQIFCIVARSYNTGDTRQWVGDECKEFGDWSKRIDTFIMHNGVSFDGPVLNKFTGSDIKIDQIRDTMIESQLFDPNREHNLKSWGNFFKHPKGEHNDFTQYSEQMLRYCYKDTAVTKETAVYLEENKDFSSQSYELERSVRSIIDQQQKNGFAFDIRNGTLLLSRLQDELDSYNKQAQEEIEPTIVELKTKTKTIPFNIGSSPQCADRLMKRGWKPSVFTDKGAVKMDEKVLESITHPDCKDLAVMFARYRLLVKRVAFLKAWVEACSDENRVHGKVFTLSTVTGRMSHSKPNMAQVPSVSSPYGKECRQLWTVSNPETHQLVGTDASGLEFRCLAHYINSKDFTNAVLEGDIHSYNQKKANLSTRDQAKTFIYALLYGAGPAKIGKIVGGRRKEGEKLLQDFQKEIPSLKKLRSQVDEASKGGSIKGLDGRMIKIRHQHAALNTLLQGGGAIICKQWLVEMDKEIRKTGLDAKLVASVHDEYQFEVAKPDIKKFTEITKSSIHRTTEILDLNIPLDSEYKVGNNWAETH